MFWKLVHPLLLSLITLESCRGERILSSPVVTNWGEWQAFRYCPNGTFVVGMQLKTEQYGGLFSDDTALNGVQFYCDLIDSKRDSENNAITSYADSWGSWGQKSWCGGVVTGFQLRSEGNQGPFSDDSAANNLRLFCEGSVSRFKEGDGLDFGAWTSAQHCSSYEAVCGLQVQIYTNHGSGDETAMDGMKVKCCNVPDPAVVCIPTDSWDLVIECDNLEAVSPTTCSYQRKVGTSNSTTYSEHQYEVLETYFHIGFNLNHAVSLLNLNFKTNLDVSSITGYDWKSSSSETWSEEVTTTVSFDVPPKVKSQLFQVHGTCGIYAAKPTRFKRVDSEIDGKGVLTTTVTYFDA